MHYVQHNIQMLKSKLTVQNKIGLILRRRRGHNPECQVFEALRLLYQCGLLDCMKRSIYLKIYH